MSVEGKCGVSGFRVAAATGLGALILYACGTVPETGRNQLMLISPQEEVRMAAMAFESLKKQSKVSKDTAKINRARRIGTNVARVTPMRNANWEFVVFDDPTPNAFALPGGKIGIHTGLFDLATDDAMLATVIAHEIGHVVARHGAERASQSMMVSLGEMALATGMSGQGGMSPAASRSILGAYGAGAQVGVLLPFSRVQELEADRLGLTYMARAGYDPRASLRFWQGMSDYTRKKGGPNTPTFLRTHPVNSERIAQLNSLMPQALEEYRRRGR